VIRIAASGPLLVEQPRVLPERERADEIRLREAVVLRGVVGDVLPLAALAAPVQDDRRRQARPARRDRELAPLQREPLDLDRQLGDALPERYRSPSQ
jgi:hypothetical protein